MDSQSKLTFEQLLDWVEQRLSPQNAQTVEQRVNRDPAIQAQARWLQAFNRLRKTITLEKPPAAVRTILLERFTQAVSAKQQPGLFQRLLAVLSFDSALQPALLGERTLEFERIRQLAYATDIVDVALNIQPREFDQRLDLIGQVLSNNNAFTPDMFSIQLLSGTKEIGMAMADELGEFAFEAIKPGRYQLILSGDNLDIQLPELELQR